MPNSRDSSRRKEIDKDISSYISFLRKKDKRGFSGVLKSFKGKKKKRSVEMHPEVEMYGGAEKKSKKEEEKEEKEMEMEFEEGARQKTFWEKLKGILVFEKEPEESLEEAGERTEIEEEVAEAEKAEEPKSEIEEEYKEEVQKKDWISSIIDRIFVKTREEEEFEEVSDELAEDEQDMKSIAEISTNVMKMLPPEKLKEFKQSEEFHKFKEILKKRDLIK